MQPKSDLPVDQQVAKLSELVQAHLTGMNNIQRPRLNIQPDVRDDRRRGGIVVNIELNGDEYDTTVQKKAELDRLMRDTYHVLYASGYDIKEATMSAVMIGKSYRRQSVQAPITVFKTRLKQDAAESIDWSNKENLDFNQIWDTLLLSPVWKRELQEAQGGGLSAGQSHLIGGVRDIGAVCSIRRTAQAAIMGSASALLRFARLRLTPDRLARRYCEVAVIMQVHRPVNPLDSRFRGNDDSDNH